MAIALIVGTIELLGLAAGELGLEGAFWDAVSQIDINTLGYVIVGLFVVTCWQVALLVWRLGRHRGALEREPQVAGQRSRPSPRFAPACASGR